MNLGLWLGANIRVCVCYGCTGDMKEATNMTEAIFEAIEEEIAMDTIMPTLMVGDFKPYTLQIAKRQKTHRGAGLVRCWSHG